MCVCGGGGEWRRKWEEEEEGQKRSRSGCFVCRGEGEGRRGKEGLLVGGEGRDHGDREGRGRDREGEVVFLGEEMERRGGEKKRKGKAGVNGRLIRSRMG